MKDKIQLFTVPPVDENTVFEDEDGNRFTLKEVDWAIDKMSGITDVLKGVFRGTR